MIWRTFLIGIALLAAAGPIAAQAPAPPGVTAAYDAAAQWVDVSEGGQPVLRYNHGVVPVPEGIDPLESPHGDYVNRLYGPSGELLTEDYPKDHPHHRAVNWSWGTIQWKGETRDLFWGKGIWARPVRMVRAESGPESGRIEAESVWKWDDTESVAAERVSILISRATPEGRALDFEIVLTPLVEGLEFCGRLDAGYSGFNLRMAPAADQKILSFNDLEGAVPRRSWADYSAAFPGGTARSGVTILQHRSNPGYPQEWRAYSTINFFQPIYPGGKLIPMPKDQPISLRYRLWIHSGTLDEAQCAALWDAYNNEGNAQP